MVSSIILLLSTVALSFYGVGVIWAMELDVFRTWALLNDVEELNRVRGAHWKKLPYFVFVPIGLLLILNIALFWYHPATTPLFLVGLALGIHLLSDVLTAFMWGRWQGQLTFEHHGPDSPLLARLIKTHWIRTLLVTSNGIILLWAAIATFT